MGHEIEAKYRVADHEDPRRRLRQAGAQFAGRVLETNTFFDYPDAVLRSRDCGLRIRSAQPIDEQNRPQTDQPPTCTVTYKGPRQPGPYKSRREVETAIGDPAAMTELLEALGLRPTLVFQKRRESWRLDDCNVELDELPHFGRSVEIEGNPDAIARVARRLGLADLPVEKASYADLLDALRQQKGLGAVITFGQT